MTPGSWRDAKQAHGRWKRLTAAFFKPSKPPTAFETEAFVSRVMGRLEAERAHQAWWTGRWLVPALGVGLAAALLVVSRTASDSTLPLDAQLLAGGDSSVVQLAAADASTSRSDALLLPEAP